MKKEVTQNEMPEGDAAELAKAKEIINNENKRRLAEFEQKFQALCLEYNVKIQPKVELLIVPL
jgi:hypothetical protein